MPTRTVPDPASRLLAAAFERLRATRQPVRVEELAAALDQPAVQVAATVDRLAKAGRLRRDHAGAVTGSHGLSVVPTPHELELEGHRFWTWCAWDAVGILGALGASGRIRSHSPASGAPIELAFQDGCPPPSTVVVFLAAEECSSSTVEDWCPKVNFFEDAQAAISWAARHQLAGEPLSLQAATRTGTAAWRCWLAPAAGDPGAGCQAQHHEAGRKGPPW
jgi:alkylmercury lyase